MIDELDRAGAAGDELCRRARAAGLLLIWRAQARSLRRVVVRERRPELASSTSAAGLGLQLVAASGHGVFGSRDDLAGEPAAALFDRLAELCRHGSRLGLSPVSLPELPVVRDRVVPVEPAAFAGVDLADVARRLAELEAEIGARVPGPRLQLGYRAELDAWRIRRSDGTDVTFAMPRCSLSARATSPGDGARHGVSALVCSGRPELVGDEATVRRFLRRAEASARLALALPDAPAHPAGSFPIVIDYALAKGLAHEAFGHAAEADGFRSSILASSGRFRTGQRVGAEHVSVIDEPVADDHAWQPYSANGLVRERATIVDRGRLCDGLSDPWSAAVGGVRLTGAARAESYADAPLPRMSNIRIEVAGARPAAGEFEDYGPAEVRDLLASAGVLRRHPRVVYLSGYTGGQVNAATGDFVFNCRAIYVLGEGPIVLHKPAIFSGSMFGALESIREAFGPLCLDAVGTCGKAGQNVPSSGGSHWFLVLDPHPDVRLGGS